ncbi:hypothetical protein LEP1GSC100_1239, partial [Leptospira interrogans serovar Bataviae str. UI 08561]
MGILESIHVPSEEDEAVRDYLRSRDSLRFGFRKESSEVDEVSIK